MMTLYRFLIASVLLMTGYKCSYFDPIFPHNATKYACAGSTAILPWTIQLGQGEQIVDVQWTLIKGQSSEMIAMYARGSLLSGPSFSQRVRSVPNAGIALSGVTPADNGVYTVQVLIRDSSGQLFSLQHRASLVVIDDILNGGQLTVKQEKQAVLNASTNQWSVELTCGHFAFDVHNPPFNVEWMYPSGNIIPSSHYDHGVFHLVLDNPVIGGRYVCRLPHNVQLCQDRGNRTIESSVNVDGLVARVTVLEAQNADLLAEKDGLVRNVSRLDGENHQLKRTVADLQRHHGQILHEHDALKLQAEDLQREANTTAQAITHLQQQVQALETLSAQGPYQSHDLQTQLNQSTTYCCQKITTLVQKKDELTQQEKNISLSYQTLAQRINQSDTQWSSRLNALSNHLSQVDQRLSGMNTTFLSLDSRLAQQQQVYQHLNNQTITLQKDAISANQHVQALNVSRAFERLQNVQDELRHLASGQSVADVSFHARMNSTDNIHPADGSPVIFTNVITSRGSAYNPTTGRFTAPHNGTYLFVATFSAKDRENCVQVYLMRDGEEVNYGETFSEHHYESGIVQGVLFLRVGQTAWLKNYGDNNVYAAAAGSFSGALLNRD